MGGIIQESRAALSRYTRATSSESAGGCVALALTLLSGVGHTQNNPASPAQQPQQQQNAPAPPPIIQQQVNEPEYYKANCEHPKDHDAADLCEQRRMAKAAEDGVWWSRFQTWLGGFGLIGVVGTLIFSGIAAIAASRSARVAERALTDLERPFVYVEVIKRGVHNTSEGYLAPEGQLEYECINLGRTPADLLELEEKIVEIDKDNWPDPIIPTQGPRKLPPGTVSAAGRPSKFNINLQWTIGQTRGRNGIETNLFFLGYVRYADIFGNRYITGFCAIHDPVSWKFILRGDERYNYTRKES